MYVANELPFYASRTLAEKMRKNSFPLFAVSCGSDEKPLLGEAGSGVSKLQGGLPGWLSGQRIHLKRRRHRRHGFDPWVGKIPWKRARQPTPIFLPGESHGQRILK